MAKKYAPRSPEAGSKFPPYSFRMNPIIKEKLGKIADREGCSMANIIVTLIEEKYDQMAEEKKRA